MSAKKVPMRMCVSCGEMHPKKELYRFVKTPEGIIVLDTTGRKNGRGAYICKTKSCFDKLPKAGKRIEKAFGCKLPDDVLEQLGEEFISREQDREGALLSGAGDESGCSR